jgi:hypothetical protein
VVYYEIFVINVLIYVDLVLHVIGFFTLHISWVLVAGLQLITKKTNKLSENWRLITHKRMFGSALRGTSKLDPAEAMSNTFLNRSCLLHLFKISTIVY